MRLSIPITWNPSVINLSQRWEPKNPAAPVMSTLFNFVYVLYRAKIRFAFILCSFYIPVFQWQCPRHNYNQYKPNIIGPDLSMEYIFE